MKAIIKATGEVIELNREDIVETVDRRGFISHEWRTEDKDGNARYLKDEEIEVVRA